MKIRYTWDNVDQPHDEKIAGSPWFYISTYQEFHNRLIVAFSTGHFLESKS